MVIKKASVILLAGLLASSTALAGDPLPVVSDLNIKLGAYAAFESGFSNQGKLKASEKNVSANKRGFAFYNDTALFAAISNTTDDVTYGAKIILVPTVKRKVNKDYNGSYVFLEHEFGRIEAGSPIPVAKNMMVSDGSIPIKYIKTGIDYLKQGTKAVPSFLTSEGAFLGDQIIASMDSATYSSEPPRTINYYTPKFDLTDSSKIRLGISYTPDSANTGVEKPSDKSDGIKKYAVGEATIDRFEIDRSVKDAVTSGIILEQKLTEEAELKLALTGEYGKSAGKIKKFANKDDKNPLEYKLSDLKSYNIGAELKVGDFKYNACYSSFGNSLTTKELHKGNRKSQYYNAGIAYTYNKATTTSLSYFASEQFKNKVNSVKLAVSHILAPGLKPYAEIHAYTLKGKPEVYPNLKARKVKGTVALVGVKLSL
ncbi:MAG: porin [Rickettsiaceae bacterium]|nr:porin [Rickettsiaceae bacterium]MCP5378424.1 porin [Rickettsiaceae bacterium]